MAVTMYCPNLTCPAVLQVSDKARGKNVTCSRCGLSFKVPQKPHLCDVSEPQPVVEIAACSAIECEPSENRQVESRQLQETVENSASQSTNLRTVKDFPLPRRRSLTH